MCQLLYQPVLQRDHRIVICERVTSKLENELISHSVVEWSNAELSYDEERADGVGSRRWQAQGWFRVSGRTALGSIESE
jgi:hypothetical protein